MESTQNLNEQQISHVRSILNDLIQVNRDTIEGYQNAIDAVNDEQYREILQENVPQHETFITELTALVERYGGEPEDSQTVLGRMHNAWVNLTGMITNDDAVILTECDNGLEAAVQNYHEAINTDMPENVEQDIREQFTILKGMHERIHRLSAALNQ